MNPLDDELRELLKREEPPESFAERVMARLKAAPPRSSFLERIGGLWRPRLGWIAAAAICLVIIFGVARHREQQRRRAQAEQASRQAILALQIASTELHSALEQAQRITTQALAAPKNSKKRMVQP